MTIIRLDKGGVGGVGGIGGIGGDDVIKILVLCFFINIKSVVDGLLNEILLIVRP